MVWCDVVLPVGPLGLLVAWAWVRRVGDGPQGLHWGDCDHLLRLGEPGRNRSGRRLSSRSQRKESIRQVREASSMEKDGDGKGSA